MDLIEARRQGFLTLPRHPWERARLAVVTRLIAVHATIAPGDIVIDVGCGDTFVVEALALRYPSAQFHAVDPAFTPELIDAFTGLIAAPNLRLFASLDDVPAERPASLVLLMDVLEHVDDDIGLLQDLVSRRSFDRATRLVITVPSYPRLFCAHDRFLGHYRRYTDRRLLDLIHHVGFDAVTSGHVFTTLIPARMLQIVKERLIGTTAADSEGLANWRHGERLARLLGTVLEWDGRVGLTLNRLGLPLPGLSHFAICKRSV
jgi:hypothetical protein